MSPAPPPEECDCTANTLLHLCGPTHTQPSNTLTPLGQGVAVTSINFLIPLFYHVKEAGMTCKPSQVKDTNASLALVTNKETFEMIHLFLPICYGCFRLSSIRCLWPQDG